MLVALILSQLACLSTAQADEGAEECGCDGPELSVIEAACSESGYLDVPAGVEVVSVQTCVGSDGEGNCYPSEGWFVSPDGVRVPDCRITAKAIILEF